jgi:hypothetical protein
MNPTNPGKRCSLFSSSRKTETSCWQAGYPDGPSSRAEIIPRTSTTVKVGISDNPRSSGRIVALCIKVRDLQHRRQASPERSPLRAPQKRKKKTFRWLCSITPCLSVPASQNHASSTRENKDGKFFQDIHTPKKRRENTKQSGYLTRCLSSSQMKNKFDCTNAAKRFFDHKLPSRSRQ